MATTLSVSTAGGGSESHDSHPAGRNSTGGYVDYMTLSEGSNVNPVKRNVPGLVNRDEDRHEEDHDISSVKKRRKSSVGEEGVQRVQLACFWCRTKRIRCSGTKPVCEACIKANVSCQWPMGRRRKRTRKEMEEARRAAEVAKGMTAGSTATITDGEISAGEPSVDLSNSIPTQPVGSTSAIDVTGEIYVQHHNHIPTQSSLDPLTASTVNTGSDHETAGSLGMGWGWDMSNSSSNYVWPTGFTPDGQTMTLLPELGEQNASLYLSPGAADMRLMNALESGAAYIEGDPTEDRDLELFYYRFSGSTAIHPGINRISLKLQRRQDTSSAAPQPGTDDTPLPSPPAQDLFDSSGLPHPHIYKPLFDLFFKHASQHFPSVSRQRMDERFETGTMSAFQACCICAIGARFSESAKEAPIDACAPFIAKAQELIIPLLHLPTYDVTTGLLLLSWANFGQNSESGLWQFSGMAARMSEDLGIHENSEIYESPAHVVRTRLLFWSLFVTDRIVAFATGRPASIREDIIEIPLPEDADFFPDPARNKPGDPQEQVEPVPYVQLVKLMIICGRISNVLNGRRGRARTLVNTPEPLAQQLAELQVRLVRFVSTLPESLKWSADNFKHQEARGHGGTFLALHLWANAVLALVYHPDLLKSPSGIETPLNQSMNRSIKLALASSRQIVECMVFSDLVSQTAYTSSPYLVQPLYVAAMALLHEMRATEAVAVDQNGIASTNPTNMFLLSVARQNFSAVMGAILKTEQYWAGVTYVSTILEKRSGYKRNMPKSKRTFISLPDKGLLRRFTTDREHPSNVAPATETSLREWIAKSGRSSSNPAGGPSPYWLADLMSRYTVENMSFQPADSFDLERLLATGGQMGASSSSGDGRVMGNLPAGYGDGINR